MRIGLLILFSAFVMLVNVPAITQNEQQTVKNCEVVNGDSIPVVEYEPIIISADAKEPTKRQVEKYNRLVYNVCKVYPYAIYAKNMLNELNDGLSKIQNENEKKLYLDSAENALMNRFEKELKKLTISQGKILVKLIDRETNRTTYSLVKELRSTWTAMFWQGVGRLFGYNLKIEYNPNLNSEDKEIENIINKIQWGLL